MSNASLVADSDDEHAVSMVMDGPAGNRVLSRGMARKHSASMTPGMRQLF